MPKLTLLEIASRPVGTESGEGFICIPPYQTVLTHSTPLTGLSLVQGEKSIIVACSDTGDVYTGDLSSKSPDLTVFINTKGYPTAIVTMEGLNSENPDAVTAVCCDTAHKNVLWLGSDAPEPLVSSFEKGLLGPVALAVGGKHIFYADSGSKGTTGLHNPRGSVFALSTTNSLCIPVLSHWLAAPVALTYHDGILYIAEAGENRILALEVSVDDKESGIGKDQLRFGSASVFYRISGLQNIVAMCKGPFNSLIVVTRRMGRHSRLRQKSIISSPMESDYSKDMKEETLTETFPTILHVIRCDTGEIYSQGVVPIQDVSSIVFDGLNNLYLAGVIIGDQEEEVNAIIDVSLAEMYAGFLVEGMDGY
ncbi:hypothetical protein ADUPG1_011370 [Aduncisulcus paluster]|uniref:Cleavage/polyadenylation specificity factor A subunit N-terminal domain-containing protein n=1 Tax=Aduncisulcus paluster TaxID=2918883 RepID=A0ABQ5K0C3_9EUKA|nr:hypothetical protein ADUPG1_011370 [Aduncisulcus paluster]